MDLTALEAERQAFLHNLNINDEIDQPSTSHQACMSSQNEKDISEDNREDGNPPTQNTPSTIASWKTMGTPFPTTNPFFVGPLLVRKVQRNVVQPDVFSAAKVLPRDWSVEYAMRHCSGEASAGGWIVWCD